MGVGVMAAGMSATLLQAKLANAAPIAPLTADQALEHLLIGNQRYISRKKMYLNQTQSRLQEVAQGQHPFAVILGCADSRVPPEILFDRGLGDLFVVRVAGNSLNDSTLASIEYAVRNLAVPLVMVLGHERCGAVTAVLEKQELPGHLSQFAAAILPAIEASAQEEGDRLDNAVRANIRFVTAQLRASTPVLAERVEAKQIKIVGARYDLDTGRAEVIA
jgi:carbonic anhydrase